MRGAALLTLASMVGCGGGDGDRRSSSSPPPSVTTVASTTATTLSPEDAVKAAYLAYWAMVDRIFAAPDSTDGELVLRAVDPLLSSLRDQLASLQVSGHRYVILPGRPNDHRVRDLTTDGVTASLDDCWIDGSTELDSSSNVVDSAISTKQYRARLTYVDGSWLVADITKVAATNGSSSCAGS